MANEEITARFGGDLGPLQSALRGLKGMMQKAGDSIRDSFKDAFHHLTAPLSVAGAFEAVKSVMESVKNIKRISESTGLDTGVTQDMLNLGKAAGIAGDAIESAMDKFVRGLAEGQDPGDALNAIADKMESIHDPAERARLATEAFGKAGVKLIPILKDGSEGLRKMSEEWGKLSDAEIEQLERSNKELEKVGNRGKVLLAETIVGGGKFTQAYDKMPWWQKMIPGFNLLKAYQNAKNAAPDDQPDIVTTSAPKTPAEIHRAQLEAAAKAAKELAEKEKYLDEKPQEKVLDLTRQILAARREMEDTTDDKERERLVQKIVDLEKERKGITDSIAAKAKEASEKQKETARDELQTRAQIASLTDAIANHGAQYATLEQVANSGYSFFRGNRWQYQSGPFAGMAQQVMDLESQARNERIWGNLSGAKRDESMAEQLRQSLADAGVITPDNEFKEMNQKLAKAENHLARLADKADGDGINVKGPED